MNPIIGGALVGGGMNLLGAVLNQQGTKEANEKTVQQAEKQRQYQETFAKHGLGWRIDDGMSRGLSRLAAAGAAPGAQYTPVSVGFENEKSGWANAGINIGDMAFKSVLQMQASESNELDNQIKSVQLGILEHQLDTMKNPIEQNDRKEIGSGYSESEVGKDIQWVELPGGKIQAQKSLETSQRLQDDFTGNLSFQLRRALREYNPNGHKRPPYPFTEWEPEGITGVWKPVNPDPKLWNSLYKKNNKRALGLP